MLRTYKYLLRPDPQQAADLDLLLWQSRGVYNAALDQRIRTYQEAGKGIGYAAQWTYFRDERRAQPETLGRLNASSVQHNLRRLDKAFAAFFRRVRAGETPGFPRFKGRSRFKSLEYTYGDGCKLTKAAHGRFSFYVQSVGEMRMCYHRSIPEGARIKHVVIKRVNERWYAGLMLELPDPLPAPPAADRHPEGADRHLEGVESAVGVDVGLYSLAALSDGRTVANPRWLRKSLARLCVAQRRASRRTKGGQRRRRAYEQVARLHERIANQRRDFLHKLARSLVNAYDLVAIEDLALGFMNHDPHLSLSAHDAGLGELRRLLEYKAEEAGTRVVAVNPAYTSQRCSGCGEIVEKGLSVRVHRCPYCDLVLDRDVNAARNILQLACQPPPGRGGQDGTWAVAPCVS